MLTPGLVNSVVARELLPPATRAVVQLMLIPDDDARRIADLESRLRESELAFDLLVNDNAVLEAENRKLLKEVRQLQIRLEQIESAHAVLMRRLL